jgi:hypothetical protein
MSVEARPGCGAMLEIACAFPFAGSNAEVSFASSDTTTLSLHFSIPGLSQPTAVCNSRMHPTNNTEKKTIDSNIKDILLRLFTNNMDLQNGD